MWTSVVYCMASDSGILKSRKSTVIVSQIPVKEWYDLFKDCTYADACLDRVLCKAYRLEFKGESLRNQKILTHRLTATDTPMVC